MDTQRKPTHWRTRNRLITNFDKDKLPLYTQAIQNFDMLHILPDAYDSMGRILSGSWALVSDTDADYSDFWAQFNALKEKYDQSIV